MKATVLERYRADPRGVRSKGCEQRLASWDASYQWAMSWLTAGGRCFGPPGATAVLPAAREWGYRKELTAEDLAHQNALLIAALLGWQSGTWATVREMADSLTERLASARRGQSLPWHASEVVAAFLSRVCGSLSYEVVKREMDMANPNQ